MLVVIRVLWSACSRETASGIDRWADGHKGSLEQEVAHGLTEAQRSHNQPSACLGLFPRLQGEVKGRGATAGAVRLWGSSEADPGPSLPPASTLEPGPTAGSRRTQDTQPCLLSALPTCSVL